VQLKAEVEWKAQDAEDVARSILTSGYADMLHDADRVCWCWHWR
jgi:hypothetical protein